MISNVVHDWAARPFQWGSADCVHFAGACIKAMRGYDPMDGYARYDSAWRALALIRAAGSLRECITRQLGAEPVPPGEVGEFAVAVIDSLHGEMAAIKYGGRLIAKTPAGVIDLPLNRALCAWNI